VSSSASVIEEPSDKQPPKASKSFQSNAAAQGISGAVDQTQSQSSKGPVVMKQMTISDHKLVISDTLFQPFSPQSASDSSLLLKSWLILKV
jgi:hypothetical protein